VNGEKFWWWVRHAPTRSRKLAGWTDIPADLSDADSLDRLNSALPGNAVVVSSDLLRASKTADAISTERRRAPNDARLREINFGDWELKDFREIADEYPEISEKFWTDPSSATPPGGERWDSVLERVNSFVHEFSRAQSVGDIIAVSHFGAILTQIQLATGQSSSQVLGHEVGHLSITKIRISNGGRSLLPPS